MTGDDTQPVSGPSRRYWTGPGPRRWNRDMTEHAPTRPAGADPAVSVVRPGQGEKILLGTTVMRLLEDGAITGNRVG
ncbi:hypothetical protein VR44_11900, partial [Streptomyces katrae]